MPRPVETELRTHTRALRALAAALVGEQHADDLVQDTVLQALQPHAQQPHSLRAWLATVLRYRAHKHRRSERRRQRREQLAARPEALPPADREVEAGDSLRLLTDNVLALPLPYREVLLLRYLKDLTPTEIAARTGDPLATVKSRLQRGLALLRERLDRDAADWRPALCAAFGLERAAPVAAAALSTTGVLLMGTGVKLAIVGVAAAIAVATTLFFAGGAPVAAP